MNIVWSREAVGDLAAARASIARDNPAAARRIALQIIDAVETSLVADPPIGRPGRAPGTRELVVSRTPFVIPYRVKNDEIQILRVYHGARRWPETF